MTSIAVTFALPAESLEFLKRLSSKSKADCNGLSIIRGNIGEHQIEVLHTGVGEKSCRERLPGFLGQKKFNLLISSGFAGALNDEAAIGDLLLATNFSTFLLNKDRSLFSGFGIRSADLVTLSQLVDSAEARNRIARESRGAAVDMETEFIARGCAEHGIPLLSLRAISDTPSAPFPLPPDILFNLHKQRTDMAALTTFLVTHPASILRLIQFARRIARVRKILANALATVIREL